MIHIKSFVYLVLLKTCMATAEVGEAHPPPNLEDPHPHTLEDRDPGEMDPRDTHLEEVSMAEVFQTEAVEGFEVVEASKEVSLKDFQVGHLLQEEVFSQDLEMNFKI